MGKELNFQEAVESMRHGTPVCNAFGQIFFIRTIITPLGDEEELVFFLPFKGARPDVFDRADDFVVRNGKFLMLEGEDNVRDTGTMDPISKK